MPESVRSPWSKGTRGTSDRCSTRLNALFQMGHGLFHIPVVWRSGVLSSMRRHLILGRYLRNSATGHWHGSCTFNKDLPRIEQRFASSRTCSGHDKAWPRGFRASHGSGVRRWNMPVGSSGTTRDRSQAVSVSQCDVPREKLMRGSHILRHTEGSYGGDSAVLGTRRGSHHR